METAMSKQPSILDGKTGKRKSNISRDSEESPPAWYDPDDAMSEAEALKFRLSKTRGRQSYPYRQQLIQAFQLVHGIPHWSTTEKIRKISNDDSSPEESVGTRPMNPVSSGSLQIQRLLNLNHEGHNDHTKQSIRSIEFHPTSQVGLVATIGDVVSLYHVDGYRNSKIQSTKFEHFSLKQATFSADGLEYYVSTPNEVYFYTYDMNSGKIMKITPTYTKRHDTIRKIIRSPDNKVLVSLGHQGNMYLHSRTSKEVICTLQMNGGVQDATFNESGSMMYTVGGLDDVCVWDMNSRVCCCKFRDAGTVVGSRIAVKNSFIATGSSSGVVNLYDPVPLDYALTVSHQNPQPKSLMNLRTRVTSLVGNHSGEMIAYGSYETPGAIRMVHVRSKTVYHDFPFIRSNWGRPNGMVFSPNSGYFSFGNEYGQAYLFRLTDFHNY